MHLAPIVTGTGKTVMGVAFRDAWQAPTRQERSPR